MVTYHGPGQLVGYPIVDLGPAADLVQYLRDLEEALIGTLSVYGIDAVRVQGCSGVWVGLDKIAAVGVRVTRGITKHGYALNVSCDLGYFAGIVPCGITDKGVTSIQALTGTAPRVEDVAGEVAARLFA
jgi:lipoyl(octanoyl) transferase